MSQQHFTSISKSVRDSHSFIILLILHTLAFNDDILEIAMIKQHIFLHISEDEKTGENTFLRSTSWAML